MQWGWGRAPKEMACRAERTGVASSLWRRRWSYICNGDGGAAGWASSPPAAPRRRPLRSSPGGSSCCCCPAHIDRAPTWQLNMVCQYIHLWMYVIPAADLYRWRRPPAGRPRQRLPAQLSRSSSERSAPAPCCCPAQHPPPHLAIKTCSVSAFTCGCM